ncbi:MAG: hypothetical protein ACOCW3_01025 [Spirochaetota bacterium]
MYRPVCILLAIGAFAGLLAADEPTALEPVPDDVDLDPYAVVERHGRPDFAVRNLLVYHRSFAELPADVTFFFTDGLIREVSFAFPVENRDAARLRSDADRVAKRLRVLYGAPSATVRLSGAHRSISWRDDRGELLHTVVLTPGREEHTLHLARGDSPFAPPHARGARHRHTRETPQ